MRRLIGILTIVAVLFLLGGNASANDSDNKRIEVLAITEVSTAGGAETVTIRNPYHTRGYLIVKTENEVATASLAVKVHADNSVTNFSICDLTAITTNTTWVASFGGGLAAAQHGIDQACAHPLTGTLQIEFTVTGAGADFDVTSEILLER